MATQMQDDWIARVLGVHVVAEPTVDVGDDEDAEAGLPPPDDAELEVIWARARDAFRTASDEVDSQISALQAAMRDTDDLEMEELAEYGMNGITGNTRVPLMASIQEFGGGRAAMQKMAPRLTKAIDAFRSHLESDQRVEACDENPLGVPVSIRGSYFEALDLMEACLIRL